MRWWIWIAVGQFLLIFVAGVALYPGNANAPNGWFALHLFETTYCDLGKFDVTNPRSNHYLAIAFNFSMLIAATGFIPHWWILPRLFPEQIRSGTAVRTLGLISVIAMFGVGPTTGDSMEFIHSLFISCAAIPGLSAVILALIALTKNRQHILLIIYTWLFAAIALFHFWQHLSHFWFGKPWAQADYATQKITILAGLAWILFNSIVNRPPPLTKPLLPYRPPTILSP